MNRTIDRLLDLGAFIAGILLLFITVSISYSIFSRAVGLPSPVWIVQFNEYALLWITFLGTAWVLARGKHVSIDLLTGRFSHKGKTWFRLFHSILGVIVCLIFIWYGFWTTFGQYKRGIVDVQAIDMPKYLILMIIPIGFLLLTIQFIRQFFHTCKKTGHNADGQNLSVDEELE